MIKIDNLSKSFYVHKKEAGLKASIKSLFYREQIEKQALKNINLQVQAGEILGLIGANGAGKTTLIKILTGIIQKTSGSVAVLDFDPWKRNKLLRQQIALIMGQKAQLWWDLPAADCFLLLKEIYQIEDKEFHERLNYLTHTLAVESQLNIQVRKLSLGERMKMELIATLLHQPKVIFLDEPTIGLDFNAQNSVRMFLKSYLKDFKPAVILTSHYMADIEDLCKRVAILKDGEIIYDGDLAQIQERFSFNKDVKVYLDHEASNEKLLELTQFTSEAVRADSNCLEISCTKEKVKDVINYCFQNFKVNDLSIHEQDISESIALIMKRGIE